MTSVHGPVAATHGPGDLVLGTFGGLGAPFDCAGLRSVPLEGPHVLWLVAEGAMDLFAVDAAGQDRWHHLGRLEAGTLLMGPVQGPAHTLVSRPLPDCRLRRIPLRELVRAPQQPYGQGMYGQDDTYAPYAQQQTGSGPDGSPYGEGAFGQPAGLSPLEEAFSRGVGRGLRVLFEARVEGRPQVENPSVEDDILWMPVEPGTVGYGASFDGAGAELLVDGEMWQRMVNQQSRLLVSLGRWIERLERTHEERALAGTLAGQAAGDRADRTLLASIGTSGRGRSGARGGTDDTDAVIAVCRLVGEAGGIFVAAPPGPVAADSGDRLDPVQRIAVHSGFRTRQVALSGRWWRENTGPMVGRWAASGAPVALLWRRGGYRAVDPAAGPRGEESPRIGRANAERFEPGAVMFYRPLPDDPVSVRRLLRFGLRGTGGDMRRLVVGGLVAVGLGAVVPIATGKVLGTYVPAAENGLIVQASLTVIAVTVLSAAFMLFQNMALLRMEGRMEATLQPAVWDRLLRLPAPFFAGRSTGELASAAMGVSGVRRVLSGMASTVVQSGTVGTVNLVLLLWYSLPLAAAAVGLVALVGAVFFGTGLWQLRWQRRTIELGNKLNNRAYQTLRGLPKLRVAAAESFAFAAWAEDFARSRELQQRVGRIKNVTAVLNAVCLPLCSLTMFMLLAGPARGTMSASAFLTFNSAVTMMLTSVTQLSGALVSAVAVLPMVEQLDPMLKATPEVRSASTQPGELTGRIEARALSFRYGADGPLVLDGVSVRAEPGEFVAIVGASGCGKSTLLRLLIGFERPESGSVLYDGQDLAALDQAAVRRQCGVVLQSSQPFSGSILDCIRGSGNYTLEEAQQAAALAGLAADIEAMPMGMHTVLSDGGGAISGGQRQRLMIAQALIRRPRILFLDEATSALDNATQRIVIESTRALNATRIVIAHRLSTVMDADRVVVMDGGRIVQQGTPAELLADVRGTFHELVRRQLQ